MHIFGMEERREGRKKRNSPQVEFPIFVETRFLLPREKLGLQKQVGGGKKRKKLYYYDNN